jgi:CBS domain-containing protein
MYVESLLKNRPRDVIRISNKAVVGEAVALLVEENVGALLVHDAHDKIVGILSERDVIQGVFKWGIQALNQSVTEFMTVKIVTCAPQDTVKDLMAVMVDRGFRHLPIIENDKVFGMISMRDLVRERISEMELEANVLRDMAAVHQPR